MVALNSVSDEYKAAQKAEVIATLESAVWASAVACGVDPAELTADWQIPAEDTLPPPGDLEDRLFSLITRLEGARGV